jgi:hypothetical protein
LSKEEQSTIKALKVVGWREYVGLPELGISRVKAKVDTGARTSALHAINIRYIVKAGKTWVKFEVHPLQRTTKQVVVCEAPLIEERFVRDSGGKTSLRPVIETLVVIKSRPLRVELTLVARGTMGFRMLIGRQALQGRFVVDVGRSYLGGKKKTKKTKTPSNTKANTK